MAENAAAPVKKIRLKTKQQIRSDVQTMAGQEWQSHIESVECKFVV